MPIPFILGAIAVATAGYGVKKGIDASDDMDTAKSLNRRAQRLAEETDQKIVAAKDNATKSIEDLGRTKISIMSSTMKDFIHDFKSIKNVELEGSVGIDELKNFDVNGEGFKELEEACFQASDLASGGLGAIAGSSLLAAGTYGAVMSGGFAAASTGAGIAGLSGVAATNATLAWLGGGSLAAGGFGMAGGMAVLGGLVAGPALALGGAFMASKAEEAKWQAEDNLDEAKTYAEKGKNICTTLKAMGKRADQIDDLLNSLNDYFEDSTDDLHRVIKNSGRDFAAYSREEKVIVFKSVQLAQAVKSIVDTSLLKEDGKLTSESKVALEKGQGVLAELEA